MVRFVWQQLAELYRRGFLLFALAPLIVALVVLPEFLQHVAEIRLGMFESVAHARALANDPTRWAFGYVKLTGFLLAILGAARFWNARDLGGRWWDLRNVAWIRLALGVALFVGAAVLPEPLRGRAPEWAFQLLYWSLSLATLPLLLVIVGAFFGDRSGSLVAGYLRGWRWLPLLLLLLVAAYGPAMAVHYGLHRLALGQPAALLWPLMMLDSLVVGLNAALVGGALSLACSAWRQSD